MLTFAATSLALAAIGVRALTDNCPGFGGDMKCRAEKSGSYCKTWINPPVCYGTDTPCGCGSCPTGDDACKESSGSDSYCKFWLAKPVCQGSDTPCGCEHRRGRLLSPHIEQPAPTGFPPHYNGEQKPEDYKPYDGSKKPEGSDKPEGEYKGDTKKPEGYEKPQEEYMGGSKPDGYENPHEDTKGGWKDDKDKSYDKSGHPQYPHGDCHIGDHWCKVRTGNHGSFCKHWQSPGTCSGDDSIKCGCKPQPYDCQLEDSRCANLYSGSYCKMWLDAPYCHGTKEPCKCKPKW